MDQRIDAQSLPPLPPGLIEITAPSAQAATAGPPPLPAGLVEISAQDSLPPVPEGMEEIQSTDIPLYRGSGAQIGTMPKASAEKFGSITTALGEGLVAGPRSMIEPGISGIKQAIKQPETILPSLREGITWATTPEGIKEIGKAGKESMGGLVMFLPNTLREFIKDPKRMIEEQPLDTIFLLSAVGGGAVGLASKIRAKVKLSPVEVESVRKQLSDNEQAYATKLEAVQAMPVTEPVKEAVPVVAEATKTPEITPSTAPVIAVEPKTQAGGYTPTGEVGFQRKTTANPIEKANIESYFEAQDAQVRRGRKLTPEERLKIDDEALRRHGLDPLKPLAEQVEGGKAPEVEILPEGEAYNIGIEREKRAELERDLARQSKIKRREIPEKPEAPAKSNLSTDQMAQINKVVDDNTKSAWRAEDEPTREANRQALKTYLIENYKFKEGDVASGLLDAGNVQRAVNTLKGQFAKGELKTRALRETAVREQAMPEAEGKEGKMDVEPSTEQTVFGEESAPKGKRPAEPEIAGEPTVEANRVAKLKSVLDDYESTIKNERDKAMFKSFREGRLGTEGYKDLTAEGVKVSEGTFNTRVDKWKAEIKKRIEETADGLIDKETKSAISDQHLDEVANSKISKDYDNWRKEREGGFVVNPFVPGTSRIKEIKPALHSLYQDTFDKFHAIKSVSQIAKNEGINVPAFRDPYTLARNYLGVQGAAEEKIFYKRFKKNPDTGNIEFEGKSLQDIVKPHRKEANEFSNYLVMRRVPELVKRGIETGIELKDAEAYIAKYKDKFETSAKEFTEYNNSLLDELADAGRISKKLANDLKTQNPNYAAFNRVIEDVVNYGYVPTSRNFLNKIPNPLKKIKGSTKPIIDPIESAIKATYIITNVAERQRIAKAMMDLRDVSPELQSTIKPIRPKMSLVATLEDGTKIYRPSPFQKQGVIEYFKDGQRHYYEVPKDLYESMSQLSETGQNWMIKILRAPAQMLRAGATLTPEFAFRNPFRDNIQAYVNAKYGYVPFYDFAKGLFDMIGKPESYHKWKAAGGEWSMLVSLDRASNQATLKKVMGEKDYTAYIKNPTKILEDFSMFGEKPTRIGVFKEAKRKGVSDIEAALESREASTDFARRGAAMKSVSAIYTFLNARIQGTEKLFRTFKERPIESIAKGVAMASVPSAMLYLINRSDDKYWEIPEWQRRMFWIVPTGNGKYMRVPKGEVGVLFGSTTETVMEFMDKSREGKAHLDKQALKIIMELSPMGNLGETVPTAFRPMLEWWANKNFFTGRPIVGGRKEAILPEYQYEPYTSETAKAIGKTIGASPAKIENATRGYLGGMASYLWAAGDAILGEAGIVKKKPAQPDQAKRIPVIKGFMVNDPTGFNSETVTQFYNEYNKMDQFKRTLNKLKSSDMKQDWLDLMKKDKLHALAMTKEYVSHGEKMTLEKEFGKAVDKLSEARKKRMMVLEDGNLTSERKTELIDKIDEGILKFVVPIMARFRSLEEIAKESD